MGLVLSISLALMITRKSCTKRKGIHLEPAVQSDIQPLIKREKSFDSPHAHF